MPPYKGIIEYAYGRQAELFSPPSRGGLGGGMCAANIFDALLPSPLSNPLSDCDKRGPVRGAEQE